MEPLVTITMDGPGKNALGTEMMAFLVRQLAAADGRPLLLTGAGDAFSAGLNLKEVGALDGSTIGDFLRRLEACLSALYLYPGPTVALVNGHAIAGGCVLALCCDWRVALVHPKSKIGLNEVALGLRFPPRTLEIVRRRVPAQHHQEVLLGAALHDPTQALRLGLVDEVVATVESATIRANDRLTALGAHPIDAYAATKRALRGTESELCRDDDQERLLRDAMPAWTSPMLKARIDAVLSSRRAR